MPIFPSCLCAGCFSRVQATFRPPKFNRSFEVFFMCLQVVFMCYVRAVAKP